MNNSSVYDKNTRGKDVPVASAVLAMGELLLGFLMLLYPFLSGLSVIWLGGFVLIVAGFLRLLQSLIRCRNRVWNALAFVVYALLGALMVFYPRMTMEWWTLIIGIVLLSSGLMRLVLAFFPADITAKPWRFLNALLSVALGGMILWGWPGSSAWLIGTMLAVEMIFSGWTLLLMSLNPQAAES